MSGPEAGTHAAREEWEKVKGWEAAAARDEATFGLDASQILPMPTRTHPWRANMLKDGPIIFRVVSCPTGRLMIHHLMSMGAS